MRRLWSWCLLFLGLFLGVSGGLQAQIPLPNELRVSAINGATPSDTPPRAVRTTSRTVAAQFESNASPGFVWLVHPTGASGGQTIFPSANSDTVSVLIPFGSENQPFEVRLCMTAIAPGTVTTNPNRTFCGQGMDVFLDTEPPQIRIEALVKDGERRPVGSSEQHINGDFTVVGTVRDNATPSESIPVRVRFGSFETEVSPDSSGRFEAEVSVEGLSDGSYEIEVQAEDVPDDTSAPNVATERVR